MSFFKSKKYSLGGGSKSKHASTNSPSANEHFQVIKSSPAVNQKNKGKAPTAPSGPPDNEAEVRFENKTSGLWRVKDEGKNGIFPAQVPAGESMLVTVGTKQAPCNVMYVIELQNEKYEFQLKLAKSGGQCEMVVDWMNLANAADIDLKPTSSSSNQPIKLGHEEMIIRIKK